MPLQPTPVNPLLPLTQTQSCAPPIKHSIDKGHYLDQDFKGLESVLLKKLKVAEKQLAGSGGNSGGSDSSSSGGSSSD